MHINAGNVRGLKLKSLKNEDLRPTKDRIKKSLFDILRFKLSGKVFLDLFGGTGQIGIEAFSQGAERVIIVEKEKSNSKLIQKNIDKVNHGGNICLYTTDALNFLQNKQTKIDIAFLDPPYKATELLFQALQKLAELKFPPEIIVCETLSCENLPENILSFNLRKKYHYGRIALNMYEHQFENIKDI